VTATGRGAGSATTAQRAVAAMLLGAAHLLVSTRRTTRLHSPAPDPDPVRGRRPAGSAALAFAGPIGAVGRVLAQGDVRWRPPGSPAGAALLGLHVGAGALIEELIWRSPLIYVCRAGGRVPIAIGAGLLFVAVHLPRDGARGLPVHALNTAAWTSAALFDRRIRWSVFSHAAYNYVALALGAATDESRTP
jgi:membrane protease YdiL (CAAX protease family)